MTTKQKIESMAAIAAESNGYAEEAILTAMRAVIREDWLCDVLTDDALAEWAYPDGDSYADRVASDCDVPDDCVASDTFSDGNQTCKEIYGVGSCISKIADDAVREAAFRASR